LIVNGRAIDAAVLTIAGLYRFSAPKFRYLDESRSPRGFVIEH